MMANNRQCLYIAGHYAAVQPPLSVVENNFALKTMAAKCRTQLIVRVKQLYNSWFLSHACIKYMPDRPRKIVHNRKLNSEAYDSSDLPLAFKPPR